MEHHGKGEAAEGLVFVVLNKRSSKCFIGGDGMAVDMGIMHKAPMTVELAVQDVFGEVKLLGCCSLANQYLCLDEHRALALGKGMSLMQAWQLERLSVMPWSKSLVV